MSVTGVCAVVFIMNNVRDCADEVKIGYNNDMIDTFATFEDLEKQMVEDKDYRIMTRSSESPYMIVAIHGGNIEPFTSNVASLIAGTEYNLYLFEGIREQGNLQLHIGSRYFDEPRLKDMVRSTEVVISIHGQRDQEEEFIMVSGLHDELVGKVIDHVREVGIDVRPFEEKFSPRDIQNICNTGTSGGGVEIEISRKLRDALREDEGMCRLFTNAIRHAIGSYL